MTISCALFGAFVLGYVLGRIEINKPESEELKDIEASETL